jgi:hypothetical protein
MAKPLVFTQNGRTMGPIGREKDVDLAVAPFTATLTKSGISIVAAEPGWWKPKAQHGCDFPFEGTRFERIDSSRSAGKAAAGAIAGSLLLGPLGLLAGAALGAGKKHVVVAHYGDATVVLELDSSELQLLVGRGLLGAD